MSTSFHSVSLLPIFNMLYRGGVSVSLEDDHQVFHGQVRLQAAGGGARRPLISRLPSGEFEVIP